MRPSGATLRCARRAGSSSSSGEDEVEVDEKKEHGTRRIGHVERRSAARSAALQQRTAPMGSHSCRDPQRARPPSTPSTVEWPNFLSGQETWISSNFVLPWRVELASAPSSTLQAIHHHLPVHPKARGPSARGAGQVPDHVAWITSYNRSEACGIRRPAAGGFPKESVTGHQEGSWGLTSPSRRASQKVRRCEATNPNVTDPLVVHSRVPLFSFLLQSLPMENVL